MSDSYLAKHCALWNPGICEAMLPYVMAHGSCNLDKICSHLIKSRLYWRSRDAFANVKLVTVQIGRGKDKTNRQLVPIMVLLGADGPVITGLETCNCTQLWVLLSKFGEADQCRVKPEQLKH